ncbi:MAG: hypothetical protein ABSC94_14005 [Polyangiaceae bacterium]
MRLQLAEAGSPPAAWQPPMYVASATCPSWRVSRRTSALADAFGTALLLRTL